MDAEILPCFLFQVTTSMKSTAFGSGNKRLIGCGLYRAQARTRETITPSPPNSHLVVSPFTPPPDPSPSRLPAWSVKIRRATSQHYEDARVYSRTGYGHARYNGYNLSRPSSTTTSTHEALDAALSSTKTHATPSFDWSRWASLPP